MKTWLKSGLLAIVILSCVAPAAQAKFDYESINQLPPGERYRQLSLLLLIAGGTNADLLEMLQPLSESSTFDPLPRTNRGTSLRWMTSRMRPTPSSDTGETHTAVGPPIL